MCAIASPEVEIRPSGDESTCSASTIGIGPGNPGPGCGLDRFLDLVGLEAPRADVGTGGLALEQDPDALEIRVETPLRRDHRMAPVVTEAGFLPANDTDLGHLGAGW